MRLTAITVIVLAMLNSCSNAIVRKDLRILITDSARIALQLPRSETDSIAMKEEVSSDTLTVTGPDGRKMFFMKGIMDSTGTIHATEALREVVVTARSTNIPERNGKVLVAFDIIVPDKMINDQWQIRLVPLAVIEEDTMELEAVHITGNAYRERQIRGYELYGRFLSSIVEDTTDLVHIRLLEIFIDRNFPVMAAFKNDTAFVDMNEIQGLYGICLAEARNHYYKHLAIKNNNRKKEMTAEKFRQYVPEPYITEGIRLDSITHGDSGNLVYSYKENLDTRPGLERIEVILQGSIHYEGYEIYRIPPSPPIVFHISSLASLIEDKQVFMTQIIERRVVTSTTASINFRPGEYIVDSTFDCNQAELEYIRSLIDDLSDNGDLVADSIIITASCSPEGSYNTNRYLADRRSASISGYFSGQDIKTVRRYIPENWERLTGLLQRDTHISDCQGLLRICSLDGLDKRERLLKAHEEYPYVRDKLFPILREVLFEFHLHRRNMVKDTIHTTVPDTVYSRGLQAIRDRDYLTATRLLGKYRDINSALAFLAADYNASALAILQELPSDDRRDYLMAIAYARNGNEKKAIESFLRAIEQNRRLRFRGNLDPEIHSLISKYHMEEKIMQ